MTTIDRSQVSTTHAAQARVVGVELSRYQTPTGRTATAPSFGSFSPAAGAISRIASASVSVTDTDGFGTVLVWGVLSDGTVEMIYDGSAFSAAFDAGSSVSGTTTKSFVIQHDTPGWVANYTLHVLAYDVYGASASTTSSYTLTDAPAAPVVGNYSPSSAGTITRTGTITIDVTDDEGSAALSLVTITATLADGRSLAVYDGSAFPGPFAASSTRSNVTNGYRYSLVHDGAGWPSSSLAFRITAVDAQGRVTTSTSYTLTISDAQAGPTFGSFSPGAGAIARATAVSFDVADPDGFASITVWAVLGDGSTVVVYDGTSFGGEVDNASSVSGTTTKSFSIVYDGDGWPDDYTLHVRAVDALGASSTTSSAYTLSNPPAPPDTTAPVVANFSPAPGSTIARVTAVEFDVTDETGLALLDIKVLYSDTGEKEVAFDEDGFSARFSGKSTKTAITGGWHFKLVRAGGWPSPPTIKVRPIDTSLNIG